MLAPWLLVAWTVFVWGTRIRNILADSGGTGALAVAVGLTLLGVVSAVSLVTGRLPWALPALAGATVATWLVRIPLVLTGGHGAAFVVVHLVLATVSIGLAVLVLKSRAARRGDHTSTAPVRRSRITDTRLG